jgi:hypothetical protein
MVAVAAEWQLATSLLSRSSTAVKTSPEPVALETGLRNRFLRARGSSWSLPPILMKMKKNANEYWAPLLHSDLAARLEGRGEKSHRLIRAWTCGATPAIRRPIEPGT